MTVDTHKETRDFQAEAKQLLHLMIHALYSNKEIFLRELISNASDACDKLRFEALTDDGLYEGDSDLRVRIEVDKDKRTITVSDNGIGMSRQEVIDNIGTIAKSGTRQFIESLTGDQAQDKKLIGQFGVGFYSGFIVADRITLLTRRAGLGAEHGVLWESTGEGGYSLETVSKVDHGTQITLRLREGEDEFLEPLRLRTIVRKYSDNISLPVIMKGEEKDGEEAGEEAVNRASALWMRPKSEIEVGDYNEFYKHVAHDFEDPLAYVHTQVEGRQSYVSLLYIPQRAPFDLWDRDRRHGIKLYVRRVFIMDDAEQLMPTYLRFMRGVIDSDDLPLNVSREILQNNRQIDVMRGASVKKILGLLEEMSRNEPEKYATFWREFGRVLKEGPVEDFANRERIAGLLRFSSTHEDNEAQQVSLPDYVARMKPGQDKIYYITADTYTAAKNSPHLEIFRRRDIEVLLLHDRVDEWMLTGLTDFEGKTLQSVAKGDLDLGSLDNKGDEDALNKAADAAKDIIARLEKSLGDRVKAARASHRLTDSPACLVVEDGDMAVGLRRVLEAAGQQLPAFKPILEVNPTHPLLENIKAEADGPRFDAWAELLYEQALLSEGGQLEDPALFVKRLNELMMSLAQRGA